MNDHSSISSIRRAILLGTMFAAAGLATSSPLAAEKASTSQAVTQVSKANDALAAGSVDDSLQACLTRIPKDATAGQRMLAEQSCRRDEAARKPFEMTGGR